MINPVHYHFRTLTAELSRTYRNSVAYCGTCFENLRCKRWQANFTHSTEDRMKTPPHSPSLNPANKFFLLQGLTLSLRRCVYLANTANPPRRGQICPCGKRNTATLNVNPIPKKNLFRSYNSDNGFNPPSALSQFNCGVGGQAAS